MTKKLEWEEAQCPVCRIRYSYIKGGDKPLTCISFDCQYRHSHISQLKSKGGDSDIQQRIDKERQKLEGKL